MTFLRRLLVRFALAGLPLLLAACSSGGTTPRSPSSPPSPPPSASAASQPSGHDVNVTFHSGSDTIYGSLRLPGGATGKVPGVVILAGSGPTDRNGNSAAISGQINNLADFAAVLAQHGVASLRYDKVGSGVTGLASFAGHPGDIRLDTYVQEALDAVAALRARPEINPARVAILGHSEGGLIAMLAASRLESTQPVRALILASPLATNDVDLAVRQLKQQYADAAKSGAVSQAAAATASAHLDAIQSSLETSGTYPPDMSSYEPAIRTVFNPSAEKFLADMAKINGLSVSRSLPPNLPVLIMRGAKDQQIPDSDVQALAAAFRSSGNSQVELDDEIANVDHVYKEVPGAPNPATDYGNPSLKFSGEAAALIGAFVDRALR